MPPSSEHTVNAGEPVEFSLEDAVLNMWVDDSSVYLRLDTDDDAERPDSTRRSG